MCDLKSEVPLEPEPMVWPKDTWISWRAIDIMIRPNRKLTSRECLAVLWGTDIWVQGVPLLKLFGGIVLALCWLIVRLG